MCTREDGRTPFGMACYNARLRGRCRGRCRRCRRRICTPANTARSRREHAERCVVSTRATRSRDRTRNRQRTSACSCLRRAACAASSTPSSASSRMSGPIMGSGTAPSVTSKSHAYSYKDCAHPLHHTHQVHTVECTCISHVRVTRRTRARSPETMSLPDAKGAVQSGRSCGAAGSQVAQRDPGRCAYIWIHRLSDVPGDRFRVPTVVGARRHG